MDYWPHHFPEQNASSSHAQRKTWLDITTQAVSTCHFIALLLINGAYLCLHMEIYPSGILLYLLLVLSQVITAKFNLSKVFLFTYPIYLWWLLIFFCRQLRHFKSVLSHVIQDVWSFQRWNSGTSYNFILITSPSSNQFSDTNFAINILHFNGEDWEYVKWALECTWEILADSVYKW